MLKKDGVIFNSYNAVVAKSYDEFFQGSGNVNILKETGYEDEDLQSYVQANINSWEKAPIAELDGLTPAEFFNGIGDLDKLMDLFRLGAELSDEGMPQVLVNRFEAFGDDAVGELVKLALDENKVGDEGYMVSLMAIRVLGSIKAGKSAEKLVNLMLEVENEDELLLESLRDALVDIGLPSIEYIVQALDDTGAFGNAYEYLVMALSKAGMTNKSDRVYRCLKNCFLRMPNKIIGAACLREYGDGRAVSALRGYVEKNRDSLDKETYYEIRFAVESLGGSMDDIAPAAAIKRNHC